MRISPKPSRPIIGLWSRRDADLAVEQRQGDEVGRVVDERRFGRDDDDAEFDWRRR